MRFSLSSSLLLFLLAGPAFAASAAEIVVKPLSPEARAAAREKVLRAVDAQGSGSLAGLWADAVTCGPRLWSAIKPELGADVAPIYLLVDKGLASRAGLQTVDAAKVPADQKQNVTWLTEGGAKLGQVVVEGGIVRHRSTPKLGELVAARFLKAGEGGGARSRCRRAAVLPRPRPQPPERAGVQRDERRADAVDGFRCQPEGGVDRLGSGSCRREMIREDLR